MYAKVDTLHEQDTKVQPEDKQNCSNKINKRKKKTPRQKMSLWILRLCFRVDIALIAYSNPYVTGSSSQVPSEFICGVI